MANPSGADQTLRAENAALKQRILDLEHSAGETNTRTAAARLHRLSSVAKIGAWELDLATLTMSFSAESFRINDLEPGTALSLEQATAMVNLEARPALSAAIEAAIGRGASFDLDVPMTTRTGRAIWVRTQAVAVVEHGETIRLEGAFQDITERKQAEAAQQRATQTYVALFNSLHTGVVVTDEAGQIVDANPAAEQILGLTRSETLARTFDAPAWAILRPDHSPMPAEEYASVRALREERSVDSVEMGIVRPDGNVRWLLTSASPILVEGRGVCITFTDITERKEAEAALARERTFLAEGQALAHLGSWEYSAETGETTWSEEECRIFGIAPRAVSPPYDEMLERHIHPDDAAAMDQTFRAAVSNMAVFESEYRIVRPDGSVRVILDRAQPHVDAQGRLLNYTGASLDVTERRRTEAERAALEAELQQSRKLESIGQLAGGVAHEFNNMLAVILGYTELALGTLDPASRQLHADLEQIRVAATRSAQVTRQLLTFAGKQVIARRILDLNQAVADALTMLRPLIGEHIQVTWRPAAGLGSIMADPAQISELLSNLCSNARDAIVDTGHVTIETEPATIDAAYCARHPEAAPGHYACLVVTDDGCGMAPDTLEKAFEPFFTTKGVGRGTGLGLSSVMGIVLQHGGFVSASSTLGAGTTVRLYFPSPVEETRQARPRTTKELPRGHSETVLVVEDEEALLALTSKLLTRQGYTVLAAASPGEALRLANEHTGTIHLLLADLVLPEMTGTDLAERIVALRPQVRVLFMSGYAQSVVGTGAVLRAHADLLRKPFTLGGLAVSVRHVLDAEQR